MDRTDLINGRVVRALTLWRPWPWCFLHAGKRVENRDWPAPASLRDGYIALHAGKHFDHYACADMQRGEFGPVAKACPADPDQHPDSVVFAVARLAGVRQFHDAAPSRFVDPFAFGPYCWDLVDFVELAQPVPCGGRQGLWLLPADVLGRVVAQLGKAA